MSSTKKAKPARCLYRSGWAPFFILFRALRQSRAGIFFLHVCERFVSNPLNVLWRNRSARRGLQKAVNDPFKNSNPKLGIDGRIEQINVSNLDAHKSLFLLGGGWDLSLGPSVPRLLVTFVKPRRGKSSRERKNQS